MGDAPPAGHPEAGEARRGTSRRVLGSAIGLRTQSTLREIPRRLRRLGMTRLGVVAALCGLALIYSGVAPDAEAQSLGDKIKQILEPTPPPKKKRKTSTPKTSPTRSPSPKAKASPTPNASPTPSATPSPSPSPSKKKKSSPLPSPSA